MTVELKTIEDPRIVLWKRNSHIATGGYPEYQIPDTELIRILAFTSANEEGYYPARKNRLSYSLSIDHEKRVTLHYTSSKSTRIVLGKGFSKTAVFAINLDTGENFASVSTRRVTQELTILRRLVGKTGFVQLSSPSFKYEGKGGGKKIRFLLSYSPETLFEASKKMNPIQKIKAARQLVSALATLHKEQISHCDLHDRNILIRIFSDTEIKATLIDFDHSERSPVHQAEDVQQLGALLAGFWGYNVIMGIPQAAQEGSPLLQLISRMIQEEPITAEEADAFLLAHPD